jgi:CHAT domain-containing protein/tetratricopeptide (TPR) repeat protein
MASRFYSLVFIGLTGLFGLSLPLDLSSVSVIAQVQTVQDRKTEADKLVELGKQQNEKSQYREAIQSYQSALKLYRLIKDQKSEIASLITLGYAYGGNLRQYQKALDFFQLALAISKQIDDRKGEVQSLMGIGFAYSNLGDFQKRLDYDQQAVNLAKLIGDRQNEAEGLYRLGLTLELNVGNYKKAIDYYQKSLVINQQIDNHKGEINSLLALGSAYYVLGQYKKAIDFYQQSLPISKQLGNSSTEANSLGYIAYIYAALGMYQKAIAYHQKSLALAKKIGNQYLGGVSLVNLGAVYNLLGQYQKAIDHLSQSMVIAKKLNNLYMEAGILNSFGNSYKYLGNYQKAIDYYQQSLEIFTQNKNFEIDFDIGSLLNDLGDVYSSLGQNQKAIDYYQKSLEIFKKIGFREGEATTLKGFGKLFAKLQQSELAILFYKQSVNITESIRKDIRKLDKDIQKSYLATVEETYRNLADLLLKQDRILEAQQVLDLLKVEELNEYLRNVRGNKETALGTDFQRPEQTIIALGNELADLQKLDRESKLDTSKQQRLAYLTNQESDRNQQFNAFLKSPEIQKQIEELRRIEKSQNVDIEKYNRLRKNLAQVPNAAIFYPLILSDRLELILVTNSTTPIRKTIKLKREDLSQAIIEFRNSLRDSSSNDVKEDGQKFYSWLIQPFEKELQEANIQTLIYAPDGQLRYIPLAALYDGKQWLIERYCINNITASSLTDFAPRPRNQPRILAAAATNSQNIKLGDRNIPFGALPATKTEVEAIAARIPRTTTLIDSQFSQAETLPKMQSHTIVHLATHGYFAIGQPEDSFIVFGDGSKASLKDMENWTLTNVDLVVLSACETAISGSLGNGIEILGLGYQLQDRGAGAAIASLWKVSDDGTQALMQAFYEQLKQGNVSTSEALRRAQIAMINSDKKGTGRDRANVRVVGTVPNAPDGQLSHPYYWSAFILIGNGL